MRDQWRQRSIDAGDGNQRWFVCGKEPFDGPEHVLEYLSGYTHRVAVSNSRLLNTDGPKMTFRIKNYRADSHARHTTMKLDAAEFIRRFLLHVLPKGFHRIRHDGLLATGTRAKNVKRARALLDTAAPRTDASDLVSRTQSQPTTARAARCRHVPAAARDCLSSNGSSAEKCPGISPRHPSSSSGSTPHDRSRALSS